MAKHFVPSVATYSGLIAPHNYYFSS